MPATGGNVNGPEGGQRGPPNSLEPLFLSLFLSFSPCLFWSGGKDTQKQNPVSPRQDVETWNLRKWFSSHLDEPVRTGRLPILWVVQSGGGRVGNQDANARSSGLLSPMMFEWATISRYTQRETADVVESRNKGVRSGSWAGKIICFFSFNVSRVEACVVYEQVRKREKNGGGDKEE